MAADTDSPVLLEDPTGSLPAEAGEARPATAGTDAVVAGDTSVAGGTDAGDASVAGKTDAGDGDDAKVAGETDSREGDDATVAGETDAGEGNDATFAGAVGDGGPPGPELAAAVDAPPGAELTSARAALATTSTASSPRKRSRDLRLVRVRIGGTTSSGADPRPPVSGRGSPCDAGTSDQVADAT